MHKITLNRLYGPRRGVALAVALVLCGAGCGDDAAGLQDAAAVQAGDAAAVQAGDAAAASACAVTWATLTLQGTSLRRALIDPTCTDPLMDDCMEDGSECNKRPKQHLVIAPESPSRPELWVHLCGTGGQPSGTSNITTAAALAGYRAVSLVYLNDVRNAARCVDPETGERYEQTCDEQTRLEIIYGTDTWPHFQVGERASIVGRLVRLLRYLDAAEPGAGWGEYLGPDGQPVWSSIAFSGFSQGSGNASLLARDQALARVVLFSVASNRHYVDEGSCEATSDCTGDAQCCVMGPEECAPITSGAGRCWRSEPGLWAQTGADGVGGPADRATPLTRTFGLVHRDEGMYDHTLATWALWQMPVEGQVADADTETPPYGGTHQLTTGLAPCNNADYHGSIGYDPSQPKVGGCKGKVPRMADAWRYMMTAP